MLVSCLLGAWAAICLAQILRFAAAVRYLRSAEDAAPSMDDHPALVLLVPVLGEQEVIDASLDWFGGLTEMLPWLSVVYVTTEREPASDRWLSTRDLIDRRLAALTRVSVLHYPHRHGVMAHQLNYAMDRLTETFGDDLLVGVYNVDSQPSAVAVAHARAELLGRGRCVVQQYAIYPYSAPIDLASGILSHIACWQTRWSLQFEMGRTLVSQTLVRHGRRWPLMVALLRPQLYAIGHGLFLRAGCWRELSGFPEDEINEDAFFGLQLRLAGYELRTIPYLEPALPPPGIGVYLRQQAVWFNGPARAWHYLHKLIRGSDGRHRVRPRLAGRDLAEGVLETVKCWLPALYWLFGPPLAVVGLPLLIVAETEYAALLPWFGLLLWFCWGFHLLVHRASLRLGIAAAPPAGPTSAVLAYLLHGVGPLICVLRSLRGRNGVADKYKTERSVQPRSTRRIAARRRREVS